MIEALETAVFILIVAGVASISLLAASIVAWIMVKIEE